MNLLQILEAVNGTLLMIQMALVFFFARYIVLEFMKPWLSWRQARRNRAAAIAMLMIFAGECIIRGNIWVWRHFNLAYDDVGVTIGITVGVLICIVGGVCALRHFAPDEWGRAPWVLIPIIAIVLAIGLAI